MPGEFTHRVRDQVNAAQAKTVIIDSLNGYQAAMPEENAIILHIHELLQYLNRQGANTFLTVAQHGLVGEMKAPVHVTYLADTVILLRYFEALGRVRRAVSVIKKRTGSHEDTIREYRIGAGGLTLGAPLVDFQGVLRGVPTSIGKLPPLATETDRGAAIPNSCPSTVWIFAPYGRDAAVAQTLLREAAIASAICTDLATFESAIGDKACFIIVTEEALRTPDLPRLAERIRAQPSWSDLPFIMLTRTAAGRGSDPLASVSDTLGNVTFLERPFHPATFISVARTALNGRTRQYEARARIEELHESEERLRTALAAGRLGSWELNLATRQITASASYKALLRRKRDEPVTYADVVANIHPDDREHMEARCGPPSRWAATTRSTPGSSGLTTAFAGWNGGLAWCI